ncbi:MAG: hypothetical protein ACI4KA_07615 [Oscillospiraceae bacterium]
MLIMSQDKKHLIDSSLIEVTRNIGGGKDAKYALTASSTAGFGAVMLGTYAEEKNAIDELDRIFSAMLAGEKAYCIK